MSAVTTIPLEEHCELSGVAFIRDYVEFHFDGPVLRALVDPVVDVSNRIVASSDTDWRNALCALIGREVTKLEIKENVVCEVTFISGESVKIDLSTGEAESLHFVPGPNQAIEVW